MRIREEHRVGDFAGSLAVTGLSVLTILVANGPDRAWSGLAVGGLLFVLAVSAWFVHDPRSLRPSLVGAAMAGLEVAGGFDTTFIKALSIGVLVLALAWRGTRASIGSRAKRAR